MKKNAAKFSVQENDLKVSDILAINELLKQLNPQAETIDFKRIKGVLRSGTVITVRDSSKKGVLIGMGTLLPLQKFFSLCGSIEDVVVSEEYRGQGLGKRIVKGLIDKSKDLDMQFVELTSRPQRKIANKLYQSIGFERRKTNLYRFNNK